MCIDNACESYQDEGMLNKDEIAAIRSAADLATSGQAVGVRDEMHLHSVVAKLSQLDHYMKAANLLRQCMPDAPGCLSDGNLHPLWREFNEWTEADERLLK